ncbi:hypothetical protein [Nostoc sp.]|uniref:hypothetical protein n=1 Tax=Nostoc sp. TaxID=1180 RepID=UPI002FF53E01
MNSFYVLLVSFSKLTASRFLLIIPLIFFLISALISNWDRHIEFFGEENLAVAPVTVFCVKTTFTERLIVAPSVFG